MRRHSNFRVISIHANGISSYLGGHRIIDVSARCGDALDRHGLGLSHKRLNYLMFPRTVEEGPGSSQFEGGGQNAELTWAPIGKLMNCGLVRNGTICKSGA